MFLTETTYLMLTPSPTWISGRLYQRKMISRLDLLHPSLQGKFTISQVKETHDRKEIHFTPGESVYVKNFGPAQKILIGTIIRVTDPVSYAVALQEGR